MPSSLRLSPSLRQSTGRTRPRRWLGVAVPVIVACLAVSGPAAAQYGGGANLTVDPVLVEIDGVFSYFGTECAVGSTVEITIDGFPEILATTIATDDSSYTGTGVAMPDGVVAGTQYTVRATCNGVENFTVITAVCNGGTFPVDGACPDGHTVGGEDPTTTTPTGNGGSSGGGSGGSSGSQGSGGSSPDLAVTGATFAEQAAQIGATLVALGGIVVLLARRRDEPEPAMAPAQRRRR